MEKGFNKDEWHLHKCHSKIFEGLIFINLSENPNDFEEFIAPTKKFIQFHGLADAKLLTDSIILQMATGNLLSIIFMNAIIVSHLTQNTVKYMIKIIL